MNYRHGFHAGNFADCVKHAVLVRWLRLLRRKAAAFSVLDTHAGAGRFSLDSEEARRTGEWRGGIGQLLEGEVPEVLADYLAVVREAGIYPGSPRIVQALLRDEDRLVACELHPEEAATLRGVLAGDARCSVHRRDGYEAVRGLLPPSGGVRRGLVLIDPPFEREDEWERLADAVGRARGRFPTGGVLAWYPIKGRAASRAFLAGVEGAGVRDVVALEFLLRPALDAARLNGCGLLAVGAPFGLEEEAPALLSALSERLGEDGAEWRVTRVVAE